MFKCRELRSTRRTRQLLEKSGLVLIENDFGSACKLYPNPTDGNFSIDLGVVYTSVSVTITDASVKIIQTKDFQEGKLIDLKLVAAAGIYFVNIESEDKKALVRLVKK